MTLEPLTYLDHGEIFYADAEGEPDGEPVCAFRSPDDQLGNMLAAAPDLCEALQGLLSAVEADKVLGLGQWTDAANAALKKARG